MSAGNRRQNSILYIAILAACLGAGWTTGSTALGVRINHYVYDVLTTMFGSDSSTAASDQVAVVAIDERTLKQRGGMRGIRTILAGVLDDLARAKPRVVVSDVVLADPQDEKEDKRLAASLLATKKLLLPCQIVILLAAEDLRLHHLICGWRVQLEEKKGIGA